MSKQIRRIPGALSRILLDSTLGILLYLGLYDVAERAIEKGKNEIAPAIQPYLGNTISQVAEYAFPIVSASAALFISYIALREFDKYICKPFRQEKHRL